MEYTVGKTRLDKYEDEGGHPKNTEDAIEEAQHKVESLLDEMGHEIRELRRAKEELLEALQWTWPQLDGIFAHKANEIIEKYK